MGPQERKGIVNPSCITLSAGLLVSSNDPTTLGGGKDRGRADGRDLAANSGAQAFRVYRPIIAPRGFRGRFASFGH